MRLVRLARTVLVLGFAVHIHHRFHGPPLDYAGIAAAAAASWIGVPGPGEPVLIAGAIFAARHKLDLASVIAAAFGGAAAGAIFGWLVGLKVGRAVAVARGPFYRLRLSMVERGDEIFARAPVLAILVAPAPIAGIHRVGTRIYLLTTIIGAIVWAVGIGIGAYFAGPAVVDFVNDLGTVAGIGLVVLVALIVAGGILRRRRSRARGPSTTSTGTG